MDGDANGVLSAGDTDITVYAWDHRNRLTSVTDRDTYSGSATEVVDYLYDVWNRLVGKKTDPDGDGPQSTAEEYFVFDGDQVLLRFDGPQYADLADRYLWAPVIDLLLSDEKLTAPNVPGEIFWALQDNLGTVRDIARYNPATDTTSVVNHRVYDAFGKLTSETNPAVDLIFSFTGRLFDEATGLQNNTNRWYDPAVGRWLSEDPIGFAADDANLYRYVGNQPTGSIDPSGLANFWNMLTWGIPNPQQSWLDFFNPFAESNPVWEMTKASAGASARAGGRLVVGAAKTVYEIPAVIIDAGGYTVDTVVQRTTGVNLDYRPISGTAAAYDPCSARPWYVETGARTGRTAVTALSLGTSEIYGGVRDFARTGDADALSERMGPFVLVVVPAGVNALRGPNIKLAPSAEALGEMPAWRMHTERGRLFDRLREKSYPYNQVTIESACGGRAVVDSYNPWTREILSRKGSQLWEIQESSAIGYINEAARKYRPGSLIVDVPTNMEMGLAGRKLQGRIILEVPIQVNAIPKRVLDAAARRKVLIRDVEGRVY